MVEMAKVIVIVPKAEDYRKKSWAKLLTKVDSNKSNGYAFVGDWLRRGERAEVEVGSLILLYDEPGSMRNWYPHVQLVRAEADGTLTMVFDYKGHVQERSWALAVRDRIAAILAEQYGTTEQESQPEIDLSDVPTEELIAELRRRGVLGDKEEVE